MRTQWCNTYNNILIECLLCVSADKWMLNKMYFNSCSMRHLNESELKDTNLKMVGMRMPIRQ